MAPRKEKAEKSGVDESSGMIIDYLKKQKFVILSPILYLKQLYSLLTYRVPGQPSLFTQAAKTLKTLRENNLIAGKDAGKQTVYHTLQSPSSHLSPTELASLDTQIASLRQTIADAKAEEKILRNTLTSLHATLSTEALRGRVSGLEQEKAELAARVQALRTGKVKLVSRLEREQVEGGWLMWKNKAEVRKKIVIELWAMLSEEVPEGTTRAEMWEEWGLEGQL